MVVWQYLPSYRLANRDEAISRGAIDGRSCKKRFVAANGETGSRGFSIDSIAKVRRNFLARSAGNILPGRGLHLFTKIDPWGLSRINWAQGTL